MFAFIKGKLFSKGQDNVVIETGGVGYRIYTSASALEEIGRPGDDVSMHTVLNVREDAMTLYGFPAEDQLSAFELLQTVSGVGPKAALSLLSTLSPSQFGMAVITDDFKAISRAQGIGQKTAQRIILELKDKIKKQQLDFNAEDAGSITPVRVAGSTLAKEAASALMVLGYNSAQAYKAVSAVYTEGMELEDIIKSALKNMIR